MRQKWPTIGDKSDTAMAGESFYLFIDYARRFSPCANRHLATLLHTPHVISTFDEDEWMRNRISLINFVPRNIGGCFR